MLSANNSSMNVAADDVGVVCGNEAEEVAATQFAGRPGHYSKGNWSPKSTPLNILNFIKRSKYPTMNAQETSAVRMHGCQRARPSILPNSRM